MASHFALAIGLALILACGFGVVVRIIWGEAKNLHDEERRMLQAAYRAKVIDDIAKAGVASATGQRPRVPIRSSRIRLPEVLH